MDFSIIIPWIPKLAATLLIGLGVLIVLEIRAMMKRKKLPTEGAPQQAPVQVTKVRFPDTGIHTQTVSLQTAPPSPAYKKIFIAVPIIVVLLFVFVHYLSTRVNTGPEVTPTPIPTQAPTEVFIYRFGQAGDLELLNYDELKALEPDTEIIIAVTASETVQKATFTVNGEVIESDVRERTPNGELFVSYILKPGVTDYYISVALQ